MKIHQTLLGGVEFHQRFVQKVIVQYGQTQCSPCIFNLNQNCHGFYLLWGFYIHETVWNLSRKTSVIRLPRFTTENMAMKCPQHASFSTENLFFENYYFGSPMTDVFLD